MVFGSRVSLMVFRGMVPWIFRDIFVFFLEIFAFRFPGWYLAVRFPLWYSAVGFPGWYLFGGRVFWLVFGSRVFWLVFGSKVFLDGIRQ